MKKVRRTQKRETRREKDEKKDREREREAGGQRKVEVENNDAINQNCSPYFKQN